jgi:hypothetical protein
MLKKSGTEARVVLEHQTVSHLLCGLRKKPLPTEDVTEHAANRTPRLDLRVRACLGSVGQNVARVRADDESIRVHIRTIHGWDAVAHIRPHWEILRDLILDVLPAGGRAIEVDVQNVKRRQRRWRQRRCRRAMIIILVHRDCLFFFVPSVNTTRGDGGTSEPTTDDRHVRALIRDESRDTVTEIQGSEVHHHRRGGIQYLRRGVYGDEPSHGVREEE